MRIKVSNYMADFFAKNGIKAIFTVVGGGAMHMNDSFGHHPNLHCVYSHHEQASAMAAEAYFRINNEMAGLCVTSGPGAINALNGVAGAYQDSIPMIVVSGQTKTSLITRNSGLNLRTLGNQEFDIMSALGKMTKYSETVMRPEDIRYCLEKALFIALNGRPGPCWLEVPVDIQGAYIDSDILRGYDIECEDTASGLDSDEELINKINIICDKLKNAKHPVLYAGNGVRISGGKDALCRLAEKSQIPIVTCWDSIDLIETDNPYYVGRAGIMGDRPGNFAVQNSDLVLAIGNRLNIYQVGYQLDTWAREAFVVDVDIDELELKKTTIRVDLPVCCDAAKFISLLLSKLENDADVYKSVKDWIARCHTWKEKYPVVQEKHYEQEAPLNVYAFIDSFSRALPEGMITVVANGSASVVGSATYYIKKNQRFIMNCAMSSMGYDLPAAIGACVGSDHNVVMCIAGDGSIMMNLQELQTIVTNNLPIKIILINNQGYQQIRLTQTNLFEKNFVGIGPDSNDLGFPDFEKIAYAFGIPYRRCEVKTEMSNTIQWAINEPTYCLLEVCCSTDQIFEPKSATKRLKDGSLYSPPLEDLAPFLPRDELRENMVIELLDET
jgi:acetolactate synthase-1/2/3 large subunit